jgi:hypothetical protein
MYALAVMQTISNFMIIKNIDKITEKTKDGNPLADVHYHHDFSA